MKIFRPSWKWLGFLLAGALLAGLPWIYIRWKTQARVYHSAPNSLSAPVAIVFGAGLYRNGTPMPVLADRVATAVDLYQRGIVEKLLLSGDNRFPEYNEPEAMRRLAVQLGVPDSALVLDYAGSRTYDTCYRARFVFGVKKAILVSQDFHLPRAVYLCDQMGIESIGVDADRRAYRLSSLVQWNLREGAACFFAILEARITHPQPLLGPMEPMD
jgi:SanA protein